jgi:hypothetical protein
MRSRIVILTAAGALLGASACREHTLTEQSMRVEASAMTEPVRAEPARIVVTMERPGGGTSTILDLGDGQIGVAEHGPIPADVGTAPAAGANPLGDPGIGTYACDSFGTEWVADWKDAFVGVTKYREAAYAHFQTSTLTFYPGAPVYYGTNTNWLTYLGACNGDALDDLVMEVHRRVDGAWVKIYETTLDSYQKFTFYSPTPAAYRGRTYGAGGATVEHYGLAAAWTLSPKEAIP